MLTFSRVLAPEVVRNVHRFTGSVGNHVVPEPRASAGDAGVGRIGRTQCVIGESIAGFAARCGPNSVIVSTKRSCCTLFTAVLLVAKGPVRVASVLIHRSDLF